MKAESKMKRVRLIVVLSLLFILALPLVVDAAETACGPFTDVDAGNVFCQNIIDLKDLAITTGCGGGGTLYCPSEDVPREQMAAFMVRLWKRATVGSTTGPLTLQPPWIRDVPGADVELGNPGDRVGIGSNNPAAKLHVFDLYPQLRLEHQGTGNDFDLGGGALGFAVEVPGAAQTFLIQNTTGHVGVGHWSPQNTFHAKTAESTVTIESVAADTAVFGECGNGCNGVRGESNGGTGVAGFSKTFYGGWFTSETGPGIRIQAGGTADVINAYSGGNRRFAVDAGGTVRADGSYTGPADFAEMMPVAGAASRYGAGDVLVIGPDGKLVMSSKAYDTAVAGVYSARPGFVGDTRISEYGMEAAARMRNDGMVAVAIVGIVPVKVTAANGAIQPGDLLTTSNVAGHAMRCTDRQACFGATIGKALEGLQSGKGVIQVLITLR